MTDIDRLVVGAGPYAYAAAAFAQDRGISTRIVGRPMAFWRDQMPQDMYLRSGPDWHLDASGVHTFEAYLEDRGLDPVESLTKPDDQFEAAMSDGTTITADKVLAAPGSPTSLRCPTGTSTYPPPASATPASWST